MNIQDQMYIREYYLFGFLSLKAFQETNCLSHIIFNQSPYVLDRSIQT
jgi:hypothetical protein